MRKTPPAVACLLVGACATPAQQTGGLDRMYVITAFMRKPLAESLQEIGVAPADIKHLALSPGHQVLVVRWNYRVVPSFNFDVPQSMATIDSMKAYARETGAQLWINHDREQSAKVPKAPAFVQ